MTDNSNYSPLAYFSSLTLAEHNEQLQHLQSLQDDIVRKRQDLLNAEREASIEHDARQSSIADEEAQIRLAIERCEQTQDRFRVGRENDEAQLLDDLKALQGDVEELQEQVRSLDDAEADLRRMQVEMAERYQGLAERRKEFVRRFEQAASEIEGNRQSGRTVGNEVHKLEEVHSARSGQVQRATSPLRHVNAGVTAGSTLHPSMSRSSMAAAGGGGNSNNSFSLGAAEGSNRYRTVSPTRGRASSGVSFADHNANNTTGGGGGNNYPSAARGGLSPRNLSPSRRGSTGSAAGGAAAGGLNSSFNNNTNVIMSSSSSVAAAAGVTPQSGRLVALCAAGDVDAAMRLLQDHAGEVNTIDASGNTPLHAACASSVVSLPLVTALLLAGASTSAKNDDGLTPFHLAALNTSDHGQLTGHRLKRHLIYKAAVSPNQRTSRGETAAHLCASHDRHLDSLRFLVGSGLDLDIKAVSSSPQDSGTGDSTRPITAREKAQRSGSAKTMEFLESLPR